jgi:hypothetical protein
MSEVLHLTPHETLTIVTETPELLTVEVEYTPGGRKPPPHLHPDQDEHFEVLEGVLHAKVDGRDHVLRAGDTLDVPRGAVHTMHAEGTCRARWETRPAGRTADWFRTIDREQPGLRGFAKLIREYDDVFRLAGPAKALVGVLGR